MEAKILQSIFETAQSPLNSDGIAAIDQLLIEAATKYQGVEPFGFSYQTFPLNGRTCVNFSLQAKLADPWPLDGKIFCGIGRTAEEAFNHLERELAEWFAHLERMKERESATDKAA